MSKRFRVHPADKISYEDRLIKQMRVENPEGSITQMAENRSFKPTVEGSTPSGPTTTDRLIVKQCKCSVAMYLHRIGTDIKFIGCEPSVINITIKDEQQKGIMIRGQRSTKVVRCSICHRKHTIKTFSEV